MRALLDHNLPRRLRNYLTAHDIKTTREMTWDQLRNGALLTAAAANGFDAFISIDKNLEYEQNLSRLPLPIIVLDTYSNTIPDLLPVMPVLLPLLETRLERSLYVVKPNGEVLRLREPRASGR